MKPGYLPDRNTQCVYCTAKAIAFLGSPFPLLPFDINIALVQRRYHCFPLLRIFPNFHSRPYTRCMKLGYLPGRNPQCVYCTAKAIPFLGSPFPQPPFDINIALVQRRYHCFRHLRTLPNFHSRPFVRCMKTGYLPGRNAQCIYCTEKVNAFLGSPCAELPFDINIALVQRRYRRFRKLMKFPKFPFSALYSVHETGLFAGP